MKVHALWAWTIHACFMRGLLGGNQSADKHRMVPPFYYETKIILCNTHYEFVYINSMFK